MPLPSSDSSINQITDVSQLEADEELGPVQGRVHNLEARTGQCVTEAGAQNLRPLPIN